MEISKNTILKLKSVNEYRVRDNILYSAILSRLTKGFYKRTSP